MASVISLRGLYRAYRDRPAVVGVDLDVSAGEVLALLGPNGAGKTTLVEIVAGLRRPDGGEVEVLGPDPRRAGRRWRERVGVVVQEPLGQGELTVAEQLGATASCYPRRWDIAELLDAVGLGGRRLRYPRPLSRNRDVVLLRIAQEALTNIGKHARASKAAVQLEYLDAATVLTVRDDGGGIPRGHGRGVRAVRHADPRVRGERAPRCRLPARQ
jgi:ABC-2 type transport system ATP-binding protein